jgi:hypothetical protein
LAVLTLLLGSLSTHVMPSVMVAAVTLLAGMQLAYSLQR